MMPRIYIRDQNDEVADVLDEGQYFDDNMQRFLKGKATVLSFSLVKDANSYELMTTGKNLSFKYDDEDFWLNCVIVEQDELYLTVTAWSLGLEFNNETHGPYKAPKAMTFAEYLAVFDIERILVLGINEVSDKKITHEWDGTESKLARLYSLATVFSAELAFDSELNEDGSLKQITLNVYREHTDTDQGLGQDRRNDTFYFGEDIKTIRKTEDTSDLYTAIFATGKDGLTIAGIEKEVFDEDGNLLFATYKTQKPGFGDPRKLYAPQARDQFPSNTTGGDRWTLNTAGEFEYESAEALLGYMMSELKKNCQPATTWEIEGYIKAKIGDTVRIADEGYKPTLFLEARVIEQEISFTDQTKNKSTFSNVVELESQVDSNLLDQVQKLIEANKTYQYSISTDNGIVFKNNTGTTTLSATVRDGAADVTSEFEISWLKDGTAVGAGADLTVSASDVASKAVYRFNASRGGVVVGGYEVTVSDVTDGEEGFSPIVTPNDDGTLTILDVEGEKVTPDLTGPAGPPGEVDQETIDAITVTAEDAKQAGEAAQVAAEQAELDSATALTNANNAVSKANDAGAKADQSQLTADQAKSDAANALANANDALDTAGTANATANQAKSDAAGAVSVAQEAGRNANTALTNANQAIGDASNALAQSALAKSQAEEAINKYLGMGMVPAWSWSPDGTDRFTTIYPGENLLAGTADYSYGTKGANTVVLTGDDGYNGHAVIKTTISPSDLSYIDSWTYRVPEALEAGTYTVSFKAKASIEGAAVSSYFYNPNTTTSSKNSQGYESTLNDGTSLFSLTTEWKTHWVTWTQRETASPKQAILARIRRGDVPLDVYITEPKFESGINHNYIYTPASSEDYTNAVPSYIGFAIEPSDNPADYTWMRNPEKVEGEVNVELTEINGELSRKVSQESFDQLNGTVINQSTLISQNQKDIKAKADQTLVDTINKTVTDNSAAIDLNSKSIALKANQSMVDSLTGRVTTAEGSITTIAGQVDLKANKTDVDTIAGRVTSAESQLTVQAGKISGLTTTTNGHTTKIGALELQAGQFNLSLSNVQNDLNNMEIGGRNLYRNSSAELKSLTWTGYESGQVNIILSDYGLKAGDVVQYGYYVDNTNGTGNCNAMIFCYNSGGGQTGISSMDQIVKVGEKGFCRTSIVIPANTTRVMVPPVRKSGSGTSTVLYGLNKLEKGTKYTDWSPAPEDMATVTDVTSIRATVNSLTTTVASKADKTTVTQLSNQWQQTTDLANGHTSQISSLGNAVNIRVEKGDVINQINVSPESILIAGSKVHITGQTTIDSAVIGTAQIKDTAITDAKIDSLSANKVTFGTLDGLKANIINIDAKNILAETFTGFVFQGVDFIGSRFINEYSYADEDDITTTGRLEISNGTYTNVYSNTAGQTGNFRIRGNGKLDNTIGSDGVSSAYSLMPDKLILQSGYEFGVLTSKQLVLSQWVDIEYLAGYATAENNPCKYRVSYGVDGSIDVHLRGQVQKTDGSTMPMNTSFYIGILPLVGRPVRNEIFQAADDTRKGARVTVLKTGVIQIDAVNGSKYVSLSGIRVPIGY